MTFYDRVTEQLHHQKKTRKQMCEETGLSYSTIASLFNRKSKNIGIETIRLIADYLEISADYLINGTTPTHPFVSEDETDKYHSSDNEMKNEILRIFDELDIQGKTRLLTSAIDLESKKTGKP